jgi:hypothetical protein
MLLLWLFCLPGQNGHTKIWFATLPFESSHRRSGLILSLIGELADQERRHAHCS